MKAFATAKVGVLGVIGLLVLGVLTWALSGSVEAVLTFAVPAALY